MQHKKHSTNMDTIGATIPATRAAPLLTEHCFHLKSLYPDITTKLVAAPVASAGFRFLLEDPIAVPDQQKSNPLASSIVIFPATLETLIAELSFSNQTHQ